MHSIHISSTNGGQNKLLSLITHVHTHANTHIHARTYIHTHTVEGVNPRALQKKIKSGDLVVPPEKAIVLSVVEKASDADTGTKKNQ